MSKEPQKHRYFYCEDCPLERSKNQYLPDPCKGHLVRKFIKECWRKCGCSMYCGNRIVQRGITFKLQVFMTHEGKGWGLRTLEALPKGAFVCEYVGEILTNMELYERNKQSNGNDRHTYPVLLDADWGSEGVLKDEEALCLDATFYGNVARFINHR
ncbi:Histone-lysine N-methyltransferase SUVR4 [Vitis vinifera]|uniref:Histone-lysine N-methyltransferase SUVR4 n=1 Tax=Vitis vinifera TaxID=29760 RepID=A0A438HBH9_VITVI|nr:Histone-lysine N-methyltransferase SUVR4 [Vitis vinifera]